MSARHGQRRTYLAGCPCVPCKRANSAYTKRYRLRILTDPTSLGVPPGPAAAHVATLRARGMSIGAISTISDVSRSVIRRLDIQTRVRRSTAAAILAVRYTDDAGGHYVGALGTRRRIQALHSLGYSLTQIAEAIPYSLRMMILTVDGRRVSVESRTALLTRNLYDLWSMRAPVGTTSLERGRITRARAHAAARGYVPPLAWDDIDDPNETPDLGAPPRGVDLDEFARLVRWGERPDRAAERCGVALSAIEKATYRQDRPDVRALTRGAA